MGVYVWHDGSRKWTENIRHSGFRGGGDLPAGPEGGGECLLVCWRKDASPLPAGETRNRYERRLNDPLYAHLPADAGQTGRRLALYGIRYDPPERGRKSPGPVLFFPGKDRWVVGVFGMEALYVRKLTTEAGTGEDAEGERGAPKTGKLARLAIRAVYALGLDFAEVTIRLDRPSEAAVERIDPAPEAGREDWPLWRSAIAERAAAEKRLMREKPRVVLGMDPEFVLLAESGKIVPASRFFSRRGEVGFDNSTVPGRAGVHPLAELRPAPSGEPEALIRGLRKTMWTAAARIGDPGLKWMAGGMPVRGLPLGGHIHFSGVPLTGALVRALDNYLALPLFLLEDETAATRRRRYGKPGDIRKKNHGGFEYRTLPSMIVSPRVTKGAVALAKLVAENHRQLVKRPLDDLNLLASFMKGDKTGLAEAAFESWEEVSALGDYGLYARYLDPVGEWIKAGKCWRKETDFRKAWRIPPYH